MSEILLLRHGQASFGAEDYDQLSQTGETQVRMLGEHLAGLGMEFDAVYSGAMRRQRDSARLVLEGMGYPSPRSVGLLEQFNEFDHLPVLREYLTGKAGRTEDTVDIERLSRDRGYFQAVFDAATRSWIAGELRGPNLETWLDFCHRIEDG
ncbi:MAG: histidine phosphatase family protein, partial [Gammaproteobacteria bacterium]|nr:histidine phosphatase family protein [Gammaproteobacteria bacterium]